MSIGLIVGLISGGVTLLFIGIGIIYSFAVKNKMNSLKKSHTEEDSSALSNDNGEQKSNIEKFNAEKSNTENTEKSNTEKSRSGQSPNTNQNSQKNISMQDHHKEKDPYCNQNQYINRNINQEQAPKK